MNRCRVEDLLAHALKRIRAVSLLGLPQLPRDARLAPRRERLEVDARALDAVGLESF